MTKEYFYDIENDLFNDLTQRSEVEVISEFIEKSDEYAAHFGTSSSPFYSPYRYWTLDEFQIFLLSTDITHIIKTAFPDIYWDIKMWLEGKCDDL